MKVESESEVTQLCLTISDPMDCSLPGSSLCGIFQARVLGWGAIAFSGSRLWGNLNGKEIQKRGDVHICVADSLCFTAETNTVL